MKTGCNNSNKDNTNKVSCNLNTNSKVIVSLTSYPARIGFIPSVLKTIYAQTQKPDKIVLWLAEEQFPKREEDLPSELVKEVISGKLDLRWCDDLGSHKKYYYAMQEFPDDIIILIDDDNYYHPKTIETLYKKHLEFPECIVGMIAKLILIDDKNRIQAYREWPVGIYLDYPSMQLLPLGGGGVLYPAHSVDPCIFDKKNILANCNFNGVICGDDLWLKAHAILAGTLTVTQEQRNITQEVISVAQSSPNTIGNLDSFNCHHAQVLEYLLDRKGSFSDKTVRELLLDAKPKEGFLNRENDSVIKDIFTYFTENQRAIVNASTSMKTDKAAIKTGGVHFRISSFCYAMAYSNAEQTSLYIEKLQSILRLLPNIDSLIEDSIYVRALMDYSVILINSIRPKHRFPKTYLQMLSNWKVFFCTNPDLKKEYLDGYISFLNEMRKFAYSEYCKEEDKYAQECRAAVKKEWDQLSFSCHIKRLRKKIEAVYRKIRK